ncbi:MAG: RidA family protein [Candidatus Brocadiia bacterium]
MDKKIIKTNKAPLAIGPYSQAVLADGWLFLSGQIPIDPVSNQVVENDITKQSEQVLSNIKAVVESTGGTLDNIVKASVFLKDLNDFAAMNAVYQKYFTKDYPARSTIQVAKLPKDVLVEIEVIACLK